MQIQSIASSNCNLQIHRLAPKKFVTVLLAGQSENIQSVLKKALFALENDSRWLLYRCVMEQQNRGIFDLFLSLCPAKRVIFSYNIFVAQRRDISKAHTGLEQH